MSDLERIHTDSAPAAIGPYSQAIVTGDWVYCSGQIPLDPQTMEIVEGGIVEQTERVFANLRAVLEAAGTSLSSVVKTTVFLADMNEFAEMNAIYAKHFGDHRPARATVEAGGLPKGVSVEIECVALRL